MNAILAAVLLASSRAAAMDVAVEQDSGAARVAAGFVTAASCETAWAVLTDYDNLAGFVGSMKESRSRRDGGVLLVEQRARAGFLLAGKTVRVLLRVEETLGRRIEFVDLTDRDFDWYAGAWSLSPSSGGCDVRYELSAELRGAPPRWLARAVASRDVRRLLDDVRLEMERRLK